MTATIRALVCVALVLFAAICVLLSIAAIDFRPPEIQWTSWTIFAVVGLSCLLGAGWLLRPRGTIRAPVSVVLGTIRAPVSVVFLLIAVASVYQAFAAVEAGPDGQWIYWKALTSAPSASRACSGRFGCSDRGEPVPNEAIQRTPLTRGR